VMSHFKISVLLSFSMLVATLATTGSKAQANGAIQQMIEYGENVGESRVGQVTSVSQLSDVKPTDWAFQALQSLVERYGCIAGYPDRTYRGNRAMTRYEFAAGLNACMEKVNQLIEASTEDAAKKEDLEALRKLQQEFSNELAEIRGKVDSLESQTATLEKQQFSTTTKLRGEVIIAASGVLGDQRAVATGSPTATTPEVLNNTTLSNRVRLNLDTSFTGKDTLRVRLQARNTANLTAASGTGMARLGFDGDNANAVEVSKLYYRFPVGEQLSFQVDATGNEFHNGLFTVLSPFSSSGTGAITRYGRFAPNLRANVAGAGITGRFKLNDRISIEGGYIGDTRSNDPTEDNGLFNGSNKVLAQLVVKPTDNIDLAVAYGRSYYGAGDVGVTAGTGSAFANRPFGNVATTSDELNAQALLKLGSRFKLGGWYGVQFADANIGTNEATVTNWAAFAEFTDVGKEGSSAGLVFGVPPKVTDVDGGLLRANRDLGTTYHLEAFYRYKLNDKITLTPGLAVLFNPEHNNNNDTIYVGTVRTTFSF
jgi:hypothetical protein